MQVIWFPVDAKLLATGVHGLGVCERSLRSISSSSCHVDSSADPNCSALRSSLEWMLCLVDVATDLIRRYAPLQIMTSQPVATIIISNSDSWGSSRSNPC